MADTTNPFGGAAGSTGGMFGGGMWGSPQPSPYGGYGGSYGGYGGGYGGFGGGMPYGGGYGMQSPYGGSYGGYGGMQSPYGGYGMQQPYGGYGMQSPYGGYGAPQQGYGGYSPYGMPSQYGPQPSYGMPQQQTMAAPQAMAATQEGAGDAPQAMAATSDAVTPALTDADALKNIGISGSTTQTNRFDPWGPQQEQLRRYLSGMTGRIVPDGKGGFKAEEVSQEGMATTGAMGELYKQQQAGPLGFNPNSEDALLRMRELSLGGNPMVDAATGATRDITSGAANIGTGGMFQSMYDNPNIGGIDQYGRMAGQNAIGNADQYGQVYNTDIDQSGYQQMAGQGGVDTSRMQGFYERPGVDQDPWQRTMQGAQGLGSLGGGMFGQMAQGNLVNSNPYREKAIQDAMNQTSDQVKATMSSRGRYGSDAYGDAMGQALGQIATQARMQGYDTDTANFMAAAQARSGEALGQQGAMAQAAGGLTGMRQQNVANQMQAAQSMMGQQGQDFQNRLAALGGLTGAQQAGGQMRLGAAQGLSGIQGTNYQSQLGALGQMNAAQQMQNQQRQAAAQGLTGINSQDIQNRMAAAGMAPAMQGLRYDDAQRQLQVGATREAMAQQQRNYGWDQLRQFQGLVGGVPGSAGTSKGTESQPWWQTALGTAALAGGMWGGASGGA